MYEIGFYNDATGEINPPIEQGSTFILDFTITDVFSGTTANDITFRGQYRSTVKSLQAQDFTCEVLTRANGIVSCRISLSADGTAAMIPGTGVWDCELEDSNGYVMKPFGCANKAKVVAEVTR